MRPKSARKQTWSAGLIRGEWSVAGSVWSIRIAAEAVPQNVLHIQTPTTRVDGLLRGSPATVLVLSPQQEFPGPTHHRVVPVTAEKAQGVQGLAGRERIAAVV